nr:MAG TPA: hypothetical protein [Caudoviricetes sp.]
MAENNTNTNATEAKKERTLFGISYRKIKVGVGASVTVAAIGTAGYFLYKAFGTKPVQVAVETAGPVVDAALKKVFKN